MSSLARCMSPEHNQFFRSGSAHNDSQRKPDEDANFLQWLHVERKDNGEKRNKDERKFDNDDFQRVTNLRVFEEEEEEEEFSYCTEKDEGDINALPKCKVICYPQESKDSSDIYKQLKSDNHMTPRHEEGVQNLVDMSKSQRWNLYRLWRLRLQEKCQRNIHNCQSEGYEGVLQRLHEVGRDEELAILKKAQVIGMTTTCAAKNRDLLQRVKPKIVLIEEAAEVLEAHILTSIPLECERVILIGDHQQLRPNCNVYKLSKEYNLSISMFERLVKQGVPCERLSVSNAVLDVDNAV